MNLLALLLIVCAYLLGSVSSAIVVCKCMGFPDPREFGSGNPGATNVLRLAGKGAAIITLIGDTLKGMVPVMITRLISGEEWLLALTALAVFLGHLYPIFFQFRGGKGVATGFGTITAISWSVGGMMLITWLVVAGLTRISSLSAMTTALLAPIYIALLYPSQTHWILLTSVLISSLALWRHRSNIKNLIAGREKKMGG